MEVAMMKEKPSPKRSSSSVAYCCGACGYDLKLSSSARNTAGGVSGGGGGGGVVRFDAIDELRFGHVGEFRCVDVRARRLFTRRTRLLCRKCGAHVGFGYGDGAARSASSPPPRYDLRIRALRPVDAIATPPHRRHPPSHL